MAKSFIITDDSILNDYGFRVLTSGVKIDRYIKNPILLYDHKRTNKWESHEDEILPIGRIDNLRIEGTSLVGDPVFDEKDEFAQKIAGKVAMGVMMASPGLDPITTSKDPMYLLPGQEMETLVDSVLLEVSIVDIGGNQNAVGLYRNGKLIELTADGSNMPIPRISKEPEIQNQPDMKKIAITLGLSEMATEDEIVAKITADAAAKAALEAQITLSRDTQITQVVDGAVAARKFTADKREHFITLGKTSGIDTLKTTIELMASAAKPLEMIHQSADGKTVELKFDDVLAKGMDAVQAFKVEHPAEYITLYRAKYGMEPKEDKV